ncbi:MAG: hypothetical protein AAGM22_25950 [Acidobacteriota bacterium]
MSLIKRRSPQPKGRARLGASFAALAGLLALNLCPATPAAASDFAPKSVIDVVHVQPFQLDQSFRSDWQQEKPEVQSGLLVVLNIDTALVIPRDALEPVLYAGDHVVQRLNRGDKSGFVVGIIPGTPDLSTVPIWFGTPALPEAIDAQLLSTERARAEGAGIRPVGTVGAKSLAREPVVASDLTALLRDHAAALVQQYSPQEQRLADSWRLAVNNR